MKKKNWLALPIAEIILVIVWQVAEYFGNKKAGMNHHLKARRMQLWKKYYTPYGNYLIALVVLIALAYLILVIWKKREENYWNAGSLWQAALAALAFLCLIALLLGVWRKEVLFSAYLIPGLFIVWLIRLSFLRASLKE